MDLESTYELKSASVGTADRLPSYEEGNYFVSSQTLEKPALPHDEPLKPKRNSSSSRLTEFLGRRYLKYHVVYLLLLLIYLIVAVVFIILYIIERNKSLEEDIGPHPRAVIFMLADGFGPASQTLARGVHTFLSDKATRDAHFPQFVPLPLDDMVVGSIRTKSFNSHVTDSAAGATAYSCGHKTSNYQFGVDEYNKAVPTIIEAAKLKGLLTGVVVTSTISDATPAAFTAHGKDREKEDTIVEWQMSGRPFNNSKPVVDLYMGGGRCLFYPKSMGNATNKCHRDDDKNMFDRAQKLGYQMVTDKQSFDAINANTSLPLLGLLANFSLMNEIDRDRTVQPSLKEMVEKSLLLLSEASKKPDYKGFFLLVEGSRIDKTAHSNDAAAHAREVIAYNEAVQVAKNFVKENPSVLLISVSDHETGGLTLGRRNDIDPRFYPMPYSFFPQNLVDSLKSTDVLAAELIAMADDKLLFEVKQDVVKKLLREELFRLYDKKETDNFITRAPGTLLAELIADVNARLRSRSVANIVAPLTEIDLTLDDKVTTTKADELKKLQADYIKSKMVYNLGLKDGLNCTLGPLTESLRDHLPASSIPSLDKCKCQQMIPGMKGPSDKIKKMVHVETLAREFSIASSIYGQVAWSTPGHTGVDIVLYAKGAHSSKLRYSLENTEIFDFVREFLDLDLSETSRLLDLDKGSSSP